MKYKAIILDHDDTVVNSTETVNYVSFCQVLNKIRPDYKMSLEDFMKYNFDPGFHELCYDVLKFSKEEMDFQVSHWQNFISKHTPNVFEGIKDLLWKYKNAGGQIFVVSHSMARDIIRHYQEHDLPAPEKVYGWEYDEPKRKPNIWPIEDIISNYSFNRNELVMIDDLKPGKVMADNAGIDFIWAGWAHKYKDITDYMTSQSKQYALTVNELDKLIL